MKAILKVVRDAALAAALVGGGLLAVGTFIALLFLPVFLAPVGWFDELGQLGRALVLVGGGTWFVFVFGLAFGLLALGEERANPTPAETPSRSGPPWLPNAPAAPAKPARTARVEVGEA